MIARMMYDALTLFRRPSPCGHGESLNKIITIRVYLSVFLYFLKKHISQPYSRVFDVYALLSMVLQYWLT